MCGSEEGLAGLLDVLDVGDFEEAFGCVVEEPGQLGGFVGPFANKDAGGLIVVAQFEGVLIVAGSVGLVRCDQHVPISDTKVLETKADP